MNVYSEKKISLEVILYIILCELYLIIDSLIDEMLILLALFAILFMVSSYNIRGINIFVPSQQFCFEVFKKINNCTT